MKNHRDVCLATQAGFVEYLGLPGRVTTGCSNTPDHKSKYCSLHKPTAIGPDPDSSVSSVMQVALIMNKRVTRNEIHYQVVNNSMCGRITYHYECTGCMARKRFIYCNMGERVIPSSAPNF